MGVPGLTTYIYTRKEIFFDDYELSNTPLVIDGNGLAAFLYLNYLNKTAHFGGDYDRFGYLIERLFKLFTSCNVIPIVVFDGGCEAKKYKTTVERLSNRVIVLEDVRPGQLKGQCFPILMRYALKEKLFSLGVSVIQSDFEADREIAALSKKLNDAPVLSNDSDFFIFDVRYIPLPTVDFSAIKGKAQPNAVSCQIFNKTKFLRKFHNMDKSLLPLLPTLVGNDYLNRTNFTPFFNRIKMSKTNISTSQKRIKGVLEWLKNESYDSAVLKIVSCFNVKHRKHQKKLIKKMVKGYVNLETVLLNYVPDDVKRKLSQLEIENITFIPNKENEEMIGITDSEDEVEIDVEDFSSLLEEESEVDDNNHSEDDCENTGSETENDNCDTSKLNSTNFVPNWLLQLFRKGQISPVVFTLITLKTYFCSPQPENYSLPQSGEVALPLVQFLSGILIGETQFKYWSRQRRNRYEYLIVNATKPVLNLKIQLELEDLLKIPLYERKKLLVNNFGLEEINFLKSFPEDWELFILALIFWVKSAHSIIKPFHVHAVIMMLIAVDTIDSKLEFYRAKKVFLKKYESKIKTLMSIKRRQEKTQEKMSVKKAKMIVSKDDCLIVVESLMPYFIINEGVRNRKYECRSFSIPLVHAFSELQVCIEMAIILNSVLGSPFKTVQMTKLYNSTFLYNMSANLRIRNNLLAYIENFFSRSLSLLNLYLTLYQVLQLFIPDSLSQEVKPKKKKKKNKTPVDTVVAPKEDEENSDSSSYVDENNKFSLLKLT